jgi:thiol:disulfide interchange protein
MILRSVGLARGLFVSFTLAAASGLSLTLQRDNSKPPPAVLNGVLVFKDTAVQADGATGAILISAPIYSSTPAGFTRLGVVVALLLAFAGGIVLNLMPCVLPVLSIKSLRWSRTLTLPRVKHALRASLMAGMPVFVDFTAAWCITCKVNERIAFSDPSIRKAFSDAGVATLRADWTRQDPDITHELEANARAGVPLYLFYPRPKNVGEKRPPVILPQILTTSSILREVLDN